MVEVLQNTSRNLLVSLFFMAFSLPLLAAAQSDTTEHDPWKHPWGELTAKEKEELSKRAPDLVALSNGKKIQCKITKEDSLELVVNLSGTDDKKWERNIPKSDIEYFSYDYIKYDSSGEQVTIIKKDPTILITAGVFQAGGIIGVDAELALMDYVGLQAGLGLFSADVALNIHLDKSIRSSCFSLLARYQLDMYRGFGVSYIYRRDNGFTFQVGVCPYVEYLGMKNYKVNAGDIFGIAVLSLGWYIPL